MLYKFPEELFDWWTFSKRIHLFHHFRTLSENISAFGGTNFTSKLLSLHPGEHFEKKFMKTFFSFTFGHWRRKKLDLWQKLFTRLTKSILIVQRNFLMIFYSKRNIYSIIIGRSAKFYQLLAKSFQRVGHNCILCVQWHIMGRNRFNDTFIVFSISDLERKKYRTCDKMFQAVLSKLHSNFHNNFLMNNFSNRKAFVPSFSEIERKIIGLLEKIFQRRVDKTAFFASKGIILRKKIENFVVLQFRTLSKENNLGHKVYIEVVYFAFQASRETLVRKKV